MNPQVADLLTFLRFPSVSTDPECAGHGGLRGVALREAGGDGPGRDGASDGRASGGRGEKQTPGGTQDGADLRALRRAAAGSAGALDAPAVRAAIENGIVTARGATDNKGQILAHVLGVEEALKKGGLPVNLVLLIEGEEEIGSEHLEAFLVERRDSLRCDVIAVSDTGMVGRGIPTLTYGLRGIAAMEIKVTGPTTDSSLRHLRGRRGEPCDDAGADPRLAAHRGGPRGGERFLRRRKTGLRDGEETLAGAATTTRFS